MKIPPRPRTEQSPEVEQTGTGGSTPDGAITHPLGSLCYLSVAESHAF